MLKGKKADGGATRTGVRKKARAEVKIEAGDGTKTSNKIASHTLSLSRSSQKGSVSNGMEDKWSLIWKLKRRETVQTRP